MMEKTKPLGILAFIIEDDEKLSEIYSEAVNSAGYTTKIIQNGNTAIQELELFQPKLIVLDLHLPSLPGEVILQRIRADQRFSATRVIVTTADTEKAYTLEGSADLVLVKPVSFTQLRDLAFRFSKLG